MNGLFYWSSDRATVGLIVKGGVVVDAPPYARKWALGRTLAELPPAKESVFVTDENTQGTDAEGVDWGGMQTPDTVPNGAGEPVYVGPGTARDGIYPDYPPLAEAPVSINFKVTGEPMITVRGFDGAQITALLNDLSNNGVWANIAAAQADLRAQGGIGAGLGPVSAPAPQGAPPGPPQGQFPPGPQQGAPPPWAVTGPAQPSFQSGPPPQQQWQGQGGFGGGGGFQQDDKPQPAMQPPGWYRVNARSGPGFDAWKSLREQQKDYFRGKVKWGGKSDYWIEPSLAQGLAGMGYAVTQ